MWEQLRTELVDLFSRPEIKLGQRTESIDLKIGMVKGMMGGLAIHIDSELWNKPSSLTEGPLCAYYEAFWGEKPPAFAGRYNDRSRCTQNPTIVSQDVQHEGSSSEGLNSPMIVPGPLPILQKNEIASSAQLNAEQNVSQRTEAANVGTTTAEIEGQFLKRHGFAKKQSRDLKGQFGFYSSKFSKRVTNGESFPKIETEFKDGLSVLNFSSAIPRLEWNEAKKDSPTLMSVRLLELLVEWPTCVNYIIRVWRPDLTQLQEVLGPPGHPVARFTPFCYTAVKPASLNAVNEDLPDVNLIYRAEDQYILENGVDIPVMGGDSRFNAKELRCAEETVALPLIEKLEVEDGLPDLETRIVKYWALGGLPGDEKMPFSDHFIGDKMRAGFKPLDWRVKLPCSWRPGPGIEIGNRQETSLKRLMSKFMLMTLALMINYYNCVVREHNGCVFMTCGEIFLEYSSVPLMMSTGREVNICVI